MRPMAMGEPQEPADRLVVRPPPGRATRDTFLAEDALPISAWNVIGGVRGSRSHYRDAWGRPRLRRCAHASTVRSASPRATKGSRRRRRPRAVLAEKRNSERWWARIIR